MADFWAMFTRWLKYVTLIDRRLPLKVTFSNGIQGRVIRGTSAGLLLHLRNCYGWMISSFYSWESLTNNGIEEPWKSEVKARLEEAKIRKDLEKENG